MLVLGVESSCDETAVSLVEDGEVLVNSIRSQIERHRPFGGVVPDIAARMHIEAIGPLADECFRAANRSPADVDLVAATTLPGLVNCLVVGLAWARGFAVARGIPFVSVDHLEAHIYSCLLPPNDVELPLVALLVSGGHTAIYRYDGPGEIKRLARTIDDAAGEAFDKVAILLGLEYPGGPAVEKAAKGGDPKAFAFPRSKPKGRPLHFSFSGLKTAVLYATRGINQKRDAPLLPGIVVKDVAASFQEAVCDILVKNAVIAAVDEGVPTLALCGGVARNGRLRELAKERGEGEGLEVILAGPEYCTDNAAMIAALGGALVAAGKAGQDDLARPAKSRSDVA
jgi:N6-L-threonylcarbamoyladenine synthase